MADLLPYSSPSLAAPHPFTSSRGATIEAIIGGWLNAKEQRSHSAKTHKAYKETIEGFRALLQAQGLDLLWQEDETMPAFAPTIADTAQIFAQLRSPQSRRAGPVTGATQAQRLAILSSFYLYVIKREHSITTNPILLVDRPPVEAYEQSMALEHDVVASRLAEIDVSTPQGACDLAILLVLLPTGRRVSEVAALTRKNVQLTGQQLRLVFHTKGNEEMRDLLAFDVSDVLKYWLDFFYDGQFFTMSDDTPVWVQVYHRARKGEPLGYHGFAGICQHYLGTSKVHTTRGTFAIVMQHVGAKLTDIQQRLGHKNAATTGIYLNKIAREHNPFAEQVAAVFLAKRKGNASQG
jgi:site-specific recombinase XerD